jgi:hypothetical protein
MSDTVRFTAVHNNSDSCVQTVVCAAVTRRQPDALSAYWLLLCRYRYLEDSCWCEQPTVVRKSDHLLGRRSHTDGCELSCEVVQKDETDGPRILQLVTMQVRGGTACFLTVTPHQVTLQRNKLLYCAALTEQLGMRVKLGRKHKKIRVSVILSVTKN